MITSYKLWIRKIIVSSIILATTINVFAQGANDNTESVAQCDASNYDPASTVIYGRDFFARYDLTNADDMLRRIPGIVAILDNNQQGQQRGFGSGGEQILVNGNRMAGKSQNVTTNLQRIQAGAIHCVQLIRGTSSDIAVQSEGVIVNLIMAIQESGTGQGTWRVNAKFNDMSYFDIDGLLTYNGRWNGVGYLFSLEKNLWSPTQRGQLRWSEKVRNETYFYPDGSLQQTRVQSFHRQHDKYIITTNLDYELDNGDQIRLNGFVQPFTIREVDATPFTAFNPDGTVNRLAIDDRFSKSKDRLRWEIAAEYRKAALGGEFNFISIISRSSTPTLRTRNETEAGVISEISRNIDDKNESEDIFRGTYSRPIYDTLSLELGIEGARNIIDKDSQVFFDSDDNGLVELFPFPTSHSRVKELRGEMFATFNWTISDALRMEGSLIAEYSKVSNNFDFVPSKDYFFLKPRIDMRYDINERNQLAINIERTVEQLNLNDFAPTFDFADNEVDAGNLGLSPQTAWEFEIRWESRLPDDTGVIELRAFYDAIEDYLGKAIIGFDNNDPLTGDPISATGSWGKASDYGAEIKTSLRLAWLGLPDVVIDGRFLYQNSDVTVPFSVEALEFEIVWVLELGMRHDITDWGMSYGITFKNFGPSFPLRDLNFSANLGFDPHVEVFLEKELFSGITARFEANGLLPTREYRDRTLYSVNNTGGVINRNVIRSEYYEEIRDRRFLFSLRGTF